MSQTEENIRCTPKKCRQYMRVFLAHLFSHVGLCSLVVGYALVGAITFEALEAEHEVTERNRVQLTRDSCLKDMWDITLDLNVLYEVNWTELMRNKLKAYEMVVVDAVKNKGYDGKDTKEYELQWSFSGALLYSVTVITTIGYGNIAPKTASGKVVTIFYALFGIPLMLLCLTNIGDLLAHAFKFAYSRLCCVLCRDKRKYQTPAKAIQQCDGAVKYVAHTHAKAAAIVTAPTPSVSSPAILRKAPIASIDIIAEGSETESTASTTKLVLLPPSSTHSPQHHGPITLPTSKTALLPPLTSAPHLTTTNKGLSPIHFDRVQVESTSVNIERVRDNGGARQERVPISMVLGFVSGYICLGATIFSAWEEWTFLNGAYFCFITLSTIGFGDLVPGTSILDTNSETGQAKLIICCIYLILGLSIIAMSFNLVQEEVTAKCKQIGRNLGILDDNDNDD